MLNKNLKIKQMNKKVSTLIFLLIIFGTITVSFLINDINYNYSNNFEKKNDNIDNFKTIKTTSVWGILNHTNLNEVNNSHYFHNETVTIKGKLFDGGGIGLIGYLIFINVDGTDYPSFNYTTNSNGEFEINFRIPFSLEIYSSHLLEANVWNPPDSVRILNQITIYADATSYFDIDDYNQNIPKLPGTTYAIPGYLRYNNKNGNGIPSQQIDCLWYNETNDLITSLTPTFSTDIDGRLQNIPIPSDDNKSKILYLNLTYSGIPSINGTQRRISIQIYRNITVQWTTTTSTTEGNQIIISGNIFSRDSQNFVINSTTFRLRRNGASIGTTTTDMNGHFTFPFTFLGGTAGTNIIGIEVFNSPTIYSNTTHTINVLAAPLESSEDIGDDDEEEEEEDQTPLLILISVISGGVAGFLIYAYLFLKKQKEESLRVKVPLEGRIRNLKILKDSGRLEESLSYLFQAIYLELINAKYGKTKKKTETIRDFAIISVKELNLNPANIYPFIQNVEKIIYDKPFRITDKDFYIAIDLFSPIYFELTGYNFVLNF